MARRRICYFFTRAFCSNYHYGGKEVSVFIAPPDTTSFEELLDTPAAIHPSDAGKVVKVNDTGDGLEFGIITPAATVVQPETRTRVFANSSIKKTGSQEGGWQFDATATGLLGVGNRKRHHLILDSLSFKGVSIEVPNARWNNMDKIVITVSHLGTGAMTTLPAIYKADMTAGTRIKVASAGNASRKMDIYFEEDQNNLGATDTNLNRLIVEMTDSTLYIGEVIFINGTGGHTGAKGEKGDKGDKGDQGIQGAKGDTGEPPAGGSLSVNKIWRAAGADAEDA